MNLLPMMNRAKNKKNSAKDDWPWTSRSGLIELWTSQLTDKAAPEVHARIHELADRAARVLDKRGEAATGTASAHWLVRGSAGATAGIATLTGGTLIGSIHGASAIAIGIVSAVIGVLSAGIAAAKPEQSYVADLALKTQYEHLWWDMRSYALTQLPTDTADSFKAALEAFAQREAVIMGGAAPSTPALAASRPGLSQADPAVAAAQEL